VVATFLDGVNLAGPLYGNKKYDAVEECRGVMAGWRDGADKEGEYSWIAQRMRP
jgi:hypothetical protein